MLSYKIYKLNDNLAQLSVTTFEVGDLVSLSATKTSWKLSADCLFFSVDKLVFGLTSNNAYSLTNTDFRTAIKVATSSNFAYALVDGLLYKFDNSTGIKGVYKLHPSSSLTANYSTASIGSNGNKIALSIVTSTSIDVIFYYDNSTSLIKFFEIHETSYISTPKLLFSPKLSKVLLIGQKTQIAVSYYHIDYDNRITQAIDFPTENILSISATVIKL